MHGNYSSSGTPTVLTSEGAAAVLEIAAQLGLESSIKKCMHVQSMHGQQDRGHTKTKVRRQ